MCPVRPARQLHAERLEEARVVKYLPGVLGALLIVLGVAMVWLPAARLPNRTPPSTDVLVSVGSGETCTLK